MYFFLLIKWLISQIDYNDYVFSLKLMFFSFILQPNSLQSQWKEWLSWKYLY